MLFIVIGAFTSASSTSNITCAVSEWSILIGYTLELTPILVKVQPINRNDHGLEEEDSIQHVDIMVEKLKKCLILIVTPVVLYLIVWVALDMPKLKDLLILDKSGSGNTIDVEMSCFSNSLVWSRITYVWHALLILIAGVLSFLPRRNDDEAKEIRWITFLVYSQFFFLIFRIVIKSLSLSGAILGSMDSYIVSILLSVDVLVSISIYLGPKFYSIITEKSNKVWKSGLADRASTSMNRVSQLRKSGVSLILSKNELNSLNQADEPFNGVENDTPPSRHMRTSSLPPKVLGQTVSSINRERCEETSHKRKVKFQSFPSSVN